MTDKNKPNPCGCGGKPGAAGSEQPPIRRRLLQKLVASGAVAAVLPSKWTKPIVESVVVPAHAQASPVAACNAIIQDSMFEGPFDQTSVYIEIDAASVADNACGQGGDVIAEILFGGTPLAGDTVGSTCNGTVCVTSISLFVYTDQVGLAGGQFTVRFTWPGNCVCTQDITLGLIE